MHLCSKLSKKFLFCLLLLRNVTKKSIIFLNSPKKSTKYVKKDIFRGWHHFPGGEDAEEPWDTGSFGMRRLQQNRHLFVCRLLSFQFLRYIGLIRSLLQCYSQIKTRLVSLLEQIPVWLKRKATGWRHWT